MPRGLLHIDEVIELWKIPAAARYEALPSPKAVVIPQDTSPAKTYKWLTLYEMDDIGFRRSTEFKSLDGQSEPKRNALECIFKNAVFDTRFFEEIQVDEAEGAQTGPAPLLIAASLTPRPEIEAASDDWYREEHVSLIHRVPGFRRTRRYKLVESSRLREFNRIQTQAPRYLAVHEFEPGAGQGYEGGLPMGELAKVDETDRSKKMLAGVMAIDAGFWKLKKVYGKWEDGIAKL